MRSMRSAVFSALLLSLVLPGLAACTSTTVAGRVLRGDMSQALRVPEADERFEEDGFADVKVQIIQGGAIGGPVSVLASGKTNSKGAFSIQVSDQVLRSGRIRVRAEGDAIYRVDKLVDLPTPGQALLIQAVARPEGL